MRQLTAPHGVYFVVGNHEQFGSDVKYVDAVAATRIRVLTNEKVDVDGLQIVGVPYNNAVQQNRLALVLHEIGLDRQRGSVLLTHAPDQPEIAEAAASPCNSPGIHISGSLYLGAGWRGGSIASLFTALAASAICRSSLRVEQEPGDTPLRLG